MVKRKPRVIRKSRTQIGKSNMRRDKKLKAMYPGKRRSKNGKIYYENRKNRSDLRSDSPSKSKRRVVKKRIVRRKATATAIRKKTMVKRKPIVRKTRTISSREPLEGRRRHKLMPIALRRKIPKLYSQEKKKDPIVYAKFFSPYSNYTLYITEFDGKDTLFGYVTGMQKDEFGYASLNEIAKTNRGGLPLIERDMYFTPKKLSMAKRR